jgi:hypothetical protein
MCFFWHTRFLCRISACIYLGSYMIYCSLDMNFPTILVVLSLQCFDAFQMVDIDDQVIAS